MSAPYWSRDARERRRETGESASITAVERHPHLFDPPALTILFTGGAGNDDAGSAIDGFARYIAEMIGAVRQNEFRVSDLLDKLNVSDCRCRPTPPARTAQQGATLMGPG